MKLYYKSINNEANEWLAHELTVKGMKNSKPKLNLQACGRGFFKLYYDEETLFWAKQYSQDIHYGARSRVFGSSSKGMKEVIGYLHKLDRMDMIQGFFNGEWNA